MGRALYRPPRAQGQGPESREGEKEMSEREVGSGPKRGRSNLFPVERSKPRGVHCPPRCGGEEEIPFVVIEFGRDGDVSHENSV